MKFLDKISQNKQGIYYGILASFFITLMIVLVRKLSSTYHIFFIVMMRNFFSLMFFMPQIIHDHKKVIYTKKLSLHIYRGINGFIGMAIWFYAVSLLPLSEAVSLSFLAPILTTLAAMMILKEKVGKSIWFSLFIGFIGVLIILRPGFKEIQFAHLLCLATVFAWAITNILIKIMVKTEKPQTIVAYMSFTMLMISIPFALPYLQAISLKDVGLFILIGAFSNLAHTCMSISYSKADISTLQPFDFIRLIFTAIISYLIFDEIIDFWVIIGSIAILFGSVIITSKKKWRKKELPLLKRF